LAFLIPKWGLILLCLFNLPVTTILHVDGYIYFLLTLAVTAAFFPALAAGAFFPALALAAGATFFPLAKGLFATLLVAAPLGAAFFPALATGATFFPLAKGFFATVLVAVAAALGAAFFLVKGFPTARVAMEGTVNAEADANMQARVTTATDFIFSFFMDKPCRVCVGAGALRKLDL
jgi:hypothetical protein